MSRWLDAVKRGYWSDGNTPHPPKAKTTETPKTHAQAAQETNPHNQKEVLGSYGGFGFWGEGFPPEAIVTGVTAAFAEYEASNDPFRPEAWA